MSLSAREQRILSEIEHDLTVTEPPLARALASMRLGRRDRAALGRRTRRPRGRRTRRGWVIVMLAVLLAGIAMMPAGLVCDVPAVAISGAALTQLSLLAGWLARALGAKPAAGH